MTARLKNKRTLITAAGQGIGLSTALAFANEGAEVVATDINPDTLNSLSNENPRIETRLLDVTKPEEIQQAEKYVDAFNAAEASGSASIQVEGYFIDYPIVEKAQRTLDVAEAIKQSKRGGDKDRC